ncbi:DegT/DnrJ/EryC1/StrS family aminotransferase [Oligella urethralis]|uniref:DegT/DnrJ/EryC1/StrS family aminotransferase n=1 Tax=Oligella urethralis TaxID=90245 RepID=UPI000E07C15C|nr:DegT/DnrJ/EryC1/StrS family aminotransferase [Oligella urethralis]SUA57971.1 UDP-4-amino-4-deoxy-L-arabinose--oxoglutarate aminotransferase [Oligella urethralis]
MQRTSIPFSPPLISRESIKSVVETLESGWITTGPKVAEFESLLARYIGTKKVVAMNSATAAMEMTLRLFGIGEGDEVITTAYTYTASASVIHHVGAKIVLVDTQANSLEMDYAALDAAITEKTKAIIPVDIAGILCDYQKIYDIALNNKNLFKPNTTLQEGLGRVLILADAAHSFGAVDAVGRKSGEIADATCFSFHAVKNLTTGEGGAVTWTLPFSDEEIYRKLKSLILHGQTKDARTKMELGNWEYDIEELGYKNNMTDIAASIGIHQLKEYDANLVRRHKIISMYEEGLNSDLVSILDHKNLGKKSSGHLLITNVKGIDEERRNKIIMEMAEELIATNVHYKPLPMLTAYKKLGFSIKNYPNAYHHFENEITLPLYPQLTDESVNRIIHIYNKILGG